jgi:hypothetical protein
MPAAASAFFASAHVLVVAGAAGGDDRQVDRFRNAFDQREVVALHRSITVDRGDQDLAGAASFQLPCPFFRVATGGFASRMADAAVAAVIEAVGVDAGHDALSAKASGRLVDELRVGVGG